jgi:opacity protein-like surface antigen
MRKLLLAAALLAASTFGANAADLMVSAPQMAPMAPASGGMSIYAQLLGGVALSGDLEVFDDGDLAYTDTFDPGWAVAGTVGVVVMDGLSAELDVLHTSRGDPTDPDDGLETTSFMGDLKYTAALNEMFSLYGAAGVGLIRIHEIEDADVPGEYFYSGFGYQLIVGASAQVTDNVALVGEFRHQDTFGAIDDEDFDDYSGQAGVNVFLAGLKVSF